MPKFHDPIKAAIEDAIDELREADISDFEHLPNLLPIMRDVSPKFVKRYKRDKQLNQG